MQTFVDAASKIQVINGARLIKNNYLYLNCLIDSVNPLISDSVLAVQNHLNRRTLLTSDQLNSYLASSSLLHTLDGWSYLSNAIDSLLNGDSGIAIHLAYYAELRSSMSFLASEGIGTFNNNHLSTSRSNNINEYPIEVGTHKFVWDCIEKWANSSVKPTDNDLLKAFIVNNHSFEEWANAFPFTTSISRNAVVKSWLRKWNLDVRVFRDDRNTRNLTSYRPQRLSNTPSLGISSNIEKLNSFWQLLEPNGINKFQLLDKYLLRIFLQRLYDLQSNSIRNAHTLESVIITTIANLGLNQEQSLINFLKDRQRISNSLFVEATRNAIDPTTRSLNALAVIARATLMLRISTASTSNIFTRAGVIKTELNFLWEKFGVENGFWINGNAPADFYQLWDEISIHIEDVTYWASVQGPNLNLSHIYNDNDIPLSFNFFKQFHRAGLWGLSL